MHYIRFSAAEWLGSRDRGFKTCSDNHSSVALGTRSAGFTLLGQACKQPIGLLLPVLGDDTQLVWEIEIFGRRLEL